MKWKDFVFDLKFYPAEFCKNWIYPAYYLRNLLWNRYDLVRLKGIMSHEYSDCLYRMLLANMALIVEFMEKEKPEDHVCWYKDEKGKDLGHHYGESPLTRLYLPEYKDRYIMDIIKEIYQWWTVDYPAYCADRDYILGFWSDVIYGKYNLETDDDDGDDDKLYPLVLDKSGTAKTLEEVEARPGIRWDILDRYFRREDLLKGNFVRDKLTEMENKIALDEQKYLHLCIETRPYLWT